MDANQNAETAKLIGCKIPRHSSPSERMLTARHSCYSHILPPLNHSKQLVCFCSVSSPDVTSHIPLVWLPGSCVRVAWAPPIIHFSCRTRAFQNVSVLCSVPQRKVNGYLFFPHFFKKKKKDEVSVSQADFELWTQVTFLSQFDMHLEQLVGTTMSCLDCFHFKRKAK